MTNETITRTDVHAPSRIVPADYEFVGQEVMRAEFGNAPFILEERQRIQQHMLRTGGKYSTHEHGGNCMVCGSVNAVYTVLFYHVPTSTYVRMGQDCAMKVEVGDRVAFKRFRDAAEAARLAQTGKLKAQGLLAEKDLSACWTIYEAGSNGQRQESTIVDIVGKLVKYGSISDKQYAFLASLLRFIETRPAREQAREIENAAAANCPVGRVTITGVVLSTKLVEDRFARSRYGDATTLKMLVKDDSGFKVFGTVPASLMAGGDQLRGHRVTFTASVEPSRDDVKFGFFKRPTNAIELDAAVIEITMDRGLASARQ
jgi:hypothetical protein